MDIDKLNKVKKIIVHKNCHDGTCSAMIIKDVLPDVEVFYADHKAQDYLTLPVEDGLLFCDISPPHSKYKEFLDAGALVLDHHVSVEYIIRLFEQNGLGVYGHTDRGVSGAVLAYQEVWLPLKDQAKTNQRAVCKLARLAGIKDTWQKDSIEWEDASIQQSAIGFFGSEYFMENHEACLTDSEVNIGTMLYERNKVSVLRAADQAYSFEWEDKVVSIIPGGHIISDAAELLRQRGSHIIFSFQFKTDENRNPLMAISIRSDHSFDCAKFAATYGGGGHVPAAGFGIPVIPQTTLNPYAMLVAVLTESGKDCLENKEQAIPKAPKLPNLA